MNFIRLIALLLTFSLGFPAPLTAAEETPVASLVGLRMSNSALERQVRSYLTDELNASKKLRLIPDNVIQPHVDDIWSSQIKDVGDRLSQADRNLAAGKKQYNKLEIDRAIVSLSDAVKGYRESIDSLRDNRSILAAHLFLGIALVVRGNQEEGKEFMRQMIILDPDRTKHKLSAKNYPPKILKLYNQLVDQVSKGPFGTIALRTVPLGAEVYLDAVPQPKTPVDLKVPVGEHFVVMSKKGYGRFSRRVVVQEGVTPIEAKLEEWQPLSPYPPAKRNDPVSNDLLQKLGSVLGSSILILGAMEEGPGKTSSVSAQLYDTRSKEFSKIENVKIDAQKVTKSVETLKNKILQDLTVHGLVIEEINSDIQISGFSEPLSNQITLNQTSLVNTGPESSEKKEFYETWWFWTIAGAVLIGGTSAAFVLRPSPGNHLYTIDNPLIP